MVSFVWVRFIVTLASAKPRALCVAPRPVRLAAQLALGLIL